MATKYKVVGHTERRKPKDLYGVYGVPVDAIELAEDLVALERIIQLLKRIDTRNISASNTEEERTFADNMLQSQLALVRSWHRYATLRMRDYLAP